MRTLKVRMFGDGGPEAREQDYGGSHQSESWGG